MAFSCETLCRACMEPFSGNSMPLVNRKKKRKTKICENFEFLTGIKVRDNDQLPMQLCLSCVSDLNKCFGFREKCIRTNTTLRAYLDLSESESEDELEKTDDKPVFEEVPQNSVKLISRRKREPAQHSKSVEVLDYQEIEVTQEMVNNAKQQSGMLLEVGDFANLLNPTSREPNEENDDNALVYIIQDLGNNTSSDPNITEVTVQEASEDPSGENSKLQCTICKMEFVRQKNYHNHMKKFHEDGDLDEESASKRLRLSLTRGAGEDLKKQELMENPEAKRCKMCGALYLSEKSLKLHERKNACKQETYECDVCKKIFTDQKLFTEHTESHPQQQEQEEIVVQEQTNDPAKKFPCTMCPKSFKMMSTLKDHLRTHTGDKPFKCSICNRGFSQNTNLKQHLRRHTQIKPFKCDYENCEATFVSKGELDSHLRKHTGDHPFSCEQCGTKFTTSSSLVKHRRIHSGERPYQCEFCPMRFTALGTLKNHSRTHTGEKPHKCNYCSRSFTQKSDLAAHERTHTGDRPFKCKICNSAFHQSGTLKGHMKIHKKTSSVKEEADENV